MNEEQVIQLMETSQSAEAWDTNCDTVKAACNGYPDFWWESVIQSGRARTIMERWGDSPDLQISAF